MDLGEEEDDEKRRGEEVQFYGRAGGLKERKNMGKENPSGRYILYTYLHVPA